MLIPKNINLYPIYIKRIKRKYNNKKQYKLNSDPKYYECV